MSKSDPCRHQTLIVTDCERGAQCDHHECMQCGAEQHRDLWTGDAR